jgi:signal transduction histidine kinase/ligand-binding sensor domain-containing protein
MNTVSHQLIGIFLFGRRCEAILVEWFASPSQVQGERLVIWWSFKRQVFLLFTVVLLITLFGTWALAREPSGPDTQHILEKWTTENGLPQNSINDILQTRDGYLWLATHGGLVRFDGARFVVFDRSIEGIKSQRIKALCEDSKGTLWAGSEEGMLIRYRDGKFTTYKIEERLSGEEVFRIEEDDEGNLWITGRGVLIKFDGKQFIHYKHEKFEPDIDGYPAGRRVSWYQDSSGLHCLIKGRDETYSLPSQLQKAKVVGVSLDRKGNLWIQTKGAGVVKLTNGQSRLYTTREGLPSNDVAGLFLEDRTSNLWLADNRSTLYRVRNNKYELIQIFPENSLIVLCVDREGSVWIGTPVGLYRWPESALTLLTEQQGLSLNWTYSILQDRAGAIWIGTWGGGLNKYENSRFVRYRLRADSEPDTVSSIYEDSSGMLWVGANGGVSYFKNDRFHKYEDESGFLNHEVWAIHQDRSGDLWFGTDSGLVQMKNDKLIVYTTKDGLSYDFVRSLFEDRTGTLWIGTDLGLTRLKDGVFTTYTERDGFIGNQVRAIYQDNDDVLWIGTYDGGLYRFKDDRLTRYTTKEGLHDNGVFQIIEDDTGNLWMGCNRGIYRVSRQELNDFAEGRARSINPIVYGTKDGLATLECNGGRQPSGLKTKDGKLWFPTMGGVAVIDPKAIQAKPEPPVIIEEFRLGNKVVDFSGGVEIGPDRENFEIRYTALSFIKPEHIQFKYKLIGLDEDWIDAGNRRTVSYYRIPPGRYRFVVIAANSDNVWNTQGQSVEIVIIPPFWRTWWFLALMVIGLASLIFLIYERRIFRLRKEHELQTAFSRQLIHSQEIERKRIASELHDSLGQDLLVVKNSALIGLIKAEDGSEAKKQFDEISMMTSEALEDVREITHNLRPFHLDGFGLKAALEFMIEKVAGSSAIRFSTEIDAVDGVFSKEAEMHLYRIAQEIINNVVKHSGATETRLKLKCHGHSVQLMVQDNGKGFITRPNASGLRRGGFGLTGISERVRMLGAKETIDSVPGHGTTITVTVTLQDERT